MTERFSGTSCRAGAAAHPALPAGASACAGASRRGELLLLKVACDVHTRTELREIGSIYKAKIIDLSPDSMVFELIGKPEKLDAFLKMFADYTILELCRTGVTALERGGMHQHMQKPPQEVREAQFPLPGTNCTTR